MVYSQTLRSNIKPYPTFFFLGMWPLPNPVCEFTAKVYSNAWTAARSSGKNPIECKEAGWTARKKHPSWTNILPAWNLLCVCVFVFMFPCERARYIENEKLKDPKLTHFLKPFAELWKCNQDSCRIACWSTRWKSLGKNGTAAAGASQRCILLGTGNLF